jgi:hypothetical protein
MSQAVFAAILNTSTSTVQKWEIGAKRPSGPSLKLLNVIKTKGVDIHIMSHPDKPAAATRHQNGTFCKECTARPTSRM